jgi:cell wall-associated NlpC family hydrolase
MTGLDLIAEARTLIGLPFVHCGRNEHGVDCVGVILVPAQRLGLTTFEPATYSPGGHGEYLKECVEENCELVEGLAQPGDILLFRIRKRLQHLAYLTAGLTMIHAREQIGVVESFIDQRWTDRIAGVYRWKGLTEC